MKNRREIRSAVEYAAARALLFTVRSLPRSVAVAAGQGLAWLAYLLVPRLRRVGDLNLRIAYPEMNGAERRRLLRRSLLNLGRHLALFTGSKPETLGEIMECEGFEHLDAAQAARHGVIMITGHFGGWEIINFALSKRGYAGDFLVRRSKNPALDGLIDDIRTFFGAGTVDKRSAARSMLRTLHAGKLLGLLVHINVVRDQGVFVNFFGVPASTTLVTAKVSLRTGAPIVPIFAPWDEQRQRYRIRIEAPLSIERTGDEEQDIRRLTEKFTNVIEEQIRRHPDQWLWIHKRWRTQPKGQPNFYAEIE